MVIGTGMGIGGRCGVLMRHCGLCRSTKRKISSDIVTSLSRGVFEHVLCTVTIERQRERGNVK